jgi:ribosomal protein S18 acetylase RimI-like enzyme
MSNTVLMDQCRKADLPGALPARIERLAEATAALRPLYSPELVYRVNFGERTLLRELLAPNDQDSHWWQTGLYIIREGIAKHPDLHAQFGKDIDALGAELTAYLGPYDAVALREIDSNTVSGICLLSELMQYPQTTFVAPNSYSLAQALFHKNAWYRAVYAGKAPVGFIMLDDDAEKQEYYLWRFMIAPPFQGRGFGSRAMASLIDYVKSRPGATELLLSYIDHEEGPAQFYRGLGFQETGESDDGEVVMRLNLPVSPNSP